MSFPVVERGLKEYIESLGGGAAGVDAVMKKMLDSPRVAGQAILGLRQAQREWGPGHIPVRDRHIQNAEVVHTRNGWFVRDRRDPRTMHQLSDGELWAAAMHKLWVLTGDD